MGVEIVGVSTSPLSTIQAWVDDQGFQYEVWRDDAGQLGMHYGALTQPSGSPSRITKVIDAQGYVVLEYDNVLVGSHPGEVLADLEHLLGTP